jgi:hypothetical protein
MTGSHLGGEYCRFGRADRSVPRGTLQLVVKMHMPSHAGSALRGFAIVVAVPAIDLATAPEPGDLQTSARDNPDLRAREYIILR